MVAIRVEVPLGIAIELPSAIATQHTDSPVLTTYTLFTTKTFTWRAVCFWKGASRSEFAGRLWMSTIFD